MAIPAMFDNSEDIPEGLGDYYVAGEDGKFRLQVEPVSGLELSDTAALKNALSRERSNAQNAAKALKAFEGMDAEAAREAMGKVEEIANFNPEQKVEEAIRAREKQIFAKHKSEIERVQGESDLLRTQLSDNLVTSAAAKAISEAKGAVDLLLPHVLQSAKLRQTATGNFIVEVVDTEGNPRVGDAQGNPMTIPQLVDEMRASDGFSRAFEPTGATGAGTSPNASGQTKSAPRGAKTISRSDGRAIGQNLEAIASGEIQVVD